MTDEIIYDYEVKCRTCHVTFTVQLFDSHEKNLFVVDKKDWYCDTCKKDYFDKKTQSLLNEHKEKGYPELKGTAKTVSWAVKIRGELINKVDYLKQSLTFDSDEVKELSEKAFQAFFQEWQEETRAKWWIDNRRMTVRDISLKIEELKKEIESDE